MTDDMADHFKDTIAFLTARYRDDEEGLMTLANNCEATLKLLIGMTDFALSQLSMMAKLLGLDEKKMIDTLGIGMAMMVGDQ